MAILFIPFIFIRGGIAMASVMQLANYPDLSMALLFSAGLSITITLYFTPIICFIENLINPDPLPKSRKYSLYLIMGGIFRVSVMESVMGLSMLGGF
jgi:hypothetical protein